MHYFFGHDLKQKLKIEKFLEFQKQLQKEILNLEVKNECYIKSKHSATKSLWFFIVWSQKSQWKRTDNGNRFYGTTVGLCRYIWKKENCYTEKSQESVSVRKNISI